MTLGSILCVFEIFQGIIGWWIITKQWSTRNQPFELCLDNVESRVNSSLFQHDLELSFSFYLLNDLVVFVVLVNKRILNRLLSLFFILLFFIFLLLRLFTSRRCFGLITIVFISHDSCFTSTWQNRINWVIVEAVHAILVNWGIGLCRWSIFWLWISLSGRYLSIRLVQSILLCILVFRLGTTFSVWLKEGLFSCWDTNKNCSCFSIPRLLIRRLLTGIGEIVPFEFRLLTMVKIWRWNTIMFILLRVRLIITCSDAINLILATLGDRTSMVVLLIHPISSSITANRSSLIWTGTNVVIVLVLHLLMEGIHVTWCIRFIITVFFLISLGLLRNWSSKSFTGRSCILVVNNHILPIILEVYADGTIRRVFGLLRASIVLRINNLVCSRINARPIVLENIALRVFPAVNRITRIF